MLIRYSGVLLAIDPWRPLLGLHWFNNHLSNYEASTKSTTEKMRRANPFQKFSHGWLKRDQCSVQSSVSDNIQNQQKDGSPHREAIDLNDFSLGDESPVNNAETQNVGSVWNSERQLSGPSGYYYSVQRWRLEYAVEKANTDTITVLQGAFMKDDAERLATPQEMLLMHTVYKTVVSFIENKPTDKEKQKGFEAALGMPDERLRDFRDGRKLIRIKRSIARGELTEWDVGANAWCENVFKIISQAWLILKDIKEFHDLLAATDITATPESRIVVAP